MKIVNAIVLVVMICAMPAGLDAGAQAPTSKKASLQSAKRKWVPGVYRGLVVGKSTQADALKVLGKPQWTGEESESLTPMMEFTVSEPVPGRLAVLFDHGIIGEIRLKPKDFYTESSIVKVLGPDYIIVYYSFDDCLGEGGTGPIYENPDGDLESIEYRPRGIAVDLHHGEVGEISWLNGPQGPTHSQCPKTKKTRPALKPASK